MVGKGTIMHWPKTEKGANYVIIALVFFPMLFALLSGFSRNITADKAELARLIASITFPMSGILTFILAQALTLRKRFGNINCGVPSEVVLYTSMCKIGGLTIIECAITGLISLQYYKSSGYGWLIIALCLMMSIFTLLITNAILFYKHTICEEPKEKMPESEYGIEYYEHEIN